MLHLCSPTRLEARGIRKTPSLPQGPWCEVILPLRCSGSSRAPEVARLGCHSAKALIIALASCAPQQRSAWSTFREAGHLPTLLVAQSLEGQDSGSGGVRRIYVNVSIWGCRASGTVIASEGVQIISTTLENWQNPLKLNKRKLTIQQYYS